MIRQIMVGWRYQHWWCWTPKVANTLFRRSPMINQAHMSRDQNHDIRDYTIHYYTTYTTPVESRDYIYICHCKDHYSLWTYQYFHEMSVAFVDFLWRFGSSNLARINRTVLPVRHGRNNLRAVGEYQPRGVKRPCLTACTDDWMAWWGCSKMRKKKLIPSWIA